MNCKLNPSNDFLDNYILGRLSKSETETFEEHFFECNECNKNLLLRRQIIESLGGSHESIGQRRNRQKFKKNQVTIEK